MNVNPQHNMNLVGFVGASNQIIMTKKKEHLL